MKAALKSSNRKTQVKSTRKSARPARGKVQFPIVGVGASAGGLEAFLELLKYLPADTGMAFVLVQHLDPQHESALTQLLARGTSMPVAEVTDNLRVEPNQIYVIPPNRGMAIAGGMLKLTPRGKERGATRSIDFFFEALAQDQSERAIGVVLSGTASDGTLGLEAIKAADGVTFAQDESARYDSMPRSAIAAGCVDFVLSPKAIAAELARIAKHPFVLGAPGLPAAEMPAEAEREADQTDGRDAPLASGGHGTPRTGSRKAKAEAAAGKDRKGGGPDGFKKIIHLLHSHCGVDFSLYKSSTIQRRVTRRMVLNRHESLAEYAQFLRGNEKELNALYSDVLISVTSFFRNPEAFETLKHKIFPKLLAQHGRDEMRIWVLGCSTGQEAYSLAMTFAEAAADAPHVPKLQIFATDLNEALLEKARAGLYAKSLAQDVSPERLQRFFIEEEGAYRVSKAVREQVIFARQNLRSDPPFSRMDLITCRNLLIYLEPALQEKILPAFHYALKPGGFLFLGASESVGRFTELFAPADKKQKIFSRKAVPTPAFRLPLPGDRAMPSAPGRPATALSTREQALPEGLRGEFNAQREADRISVNQFAPPGVLINAEGQVLQFRGATGAYLEPPTGKASFDLLKMAREGLMLPLRAALSKAKRENQPVRREAVAVWHNGGTRKVTLYVTPLRNLKDRCFLVFFEEADEPAAERAPLSAPRPAPTGKREIASRISELERELAETRDYLQSLQEQHEAANEELQASSEEVQSSNEELQSMNEELQTSKEELESTNEELTTINDEMVSRNTELNRLYADLKNLQVNIHTAILLLARDLTIRGFTPPAADIFNLLATDVGRGFSGVRHNLEVPGLERLLAEVIDTVSLREREVRDKNGRWYSLRARPYLTLDNKVDGVVLVLGDIDTLKRSEQEIGAARDYAEATLRTMPVPFLILRADLRVNSASDAFYKTFGVLPAESEGQLIYELGNRQWDIPKMRELLEDILPKKSFFNGFEVTHDFESLGRRTMLLNARQLESDAGAPERILLAIEDITAERERDAAVRESEERYRALFESVPVAVFVCDELAKIQHYNQRAVELWGRTPDPGVESHCGSVRLFLPDGGRLPHEQSPIVEVLRTGRPALNVEVFIERPDGSRLPVIVNFAALKNASGDVTGAITSFIDISERKEAEERVRLALEEIERSSRAKDDFLAALSHELRTPLTPVLMTVTSLEGDPALPLAVREQLGMMRRNIELEARLIDDLLDLTRISRGKLQIAPVPSDLHELIQHTAEIVRSDGHGKQARIEFKNEATRSFALADPTRIQQVFWNLIKNALKFTPTGGTITVRTRNDDEGWILVSVADTGIGIGEDALPHIFNAFEQGDIAGQHRYGGLGLGLAISRAIMEVHGGAIRVASDGPGRGATFTVALASVDAPSASAHLIAPPAAPPRGLDLLIVEDHETTRLVLTRLLERNGHRIATASTMSEALAAFAKHRFDVVISDLGLPDGSGLDLMREIQRQRPVHAIALSGYGMEEDLRQTKAAGFFAHLVKPINLDQLRLLLDQIPRRL